MSRTRRRFRKKLHVGKSYRDGLRQHVSVGCEHNNSCNWCVSNRTIRAQREDARTTTG